MQSSSFQNVQQITETTGYLGNYLKSHLQCWSNQLWLMPKLANRQFLETVKFSELSYPFLARFDRSFSSILLQCPVQTLCILSVVKARAVPFPKTNFTKKKTNSKWSVFVAQHSLRNRPVLPGIITSHVNKTLSYLNAMFYCSFNWLKVTYICRI